VKFVGRCKDEDGERELYVAHIPALDHVDQLASEWDEVNGPFALFLAADASGVSTDIIGRFSQWAIDAGVFSFSVWGPDCERVHDVFDEVDVGEYPVDGAPIVMTTWHDNESLGDALLLFWTASAADGKPSGPLRLAVAVGDHDWYEQLVALAEAHITDATTD